MYLRALKVHALYHLGLWISKWVAFWTDLEDRKVCCKVRIELVASRWTKHAWIFAHTIHMLLPSNDRMLS